MRVVRVHARPDELDARVPVAPARLGQLLHARRDGDRVRDGPRARRAEHQRAAEEADQEVLLRGQAPGSADTGTKR